MSISAQNRAKFRHQGGSTILEFTLVGIPLIFVLISIFEISRGMWLYETAAHAVREGARLAAVHGNTCSTLPNVCAISTVDIATAIKNAGVGLDPTLFAVTISSGTGTSPPPPVIVGPEPLSQILLDPAIDFSVNSGSGPGEDVIVAGSYEFRSALAMFWPGGGHTSFAVVHLAATSRERIEF